MNDNRTSKPGLMQREGFKNFLASLICILIGLIIGYIVLLFINAEGAGQAMLTIIKNFFYFPKGNISLYYFGCTLVKTIPLAMCTLSVIFSKKTGLFNIGASGQYTIGAGIALFLALYFGTPWWICIPAAAAGGALWGMICGYLKAYRHVNEVISGIMLNWIALYLVNMLLTKVKNSGNPYTLSLRTNAPGALIPTLGLDKIFGNNPYVTAALPLTVILAVVVLVVLNRTLLGFELRATGLSVDAAKYAGMHEKRNMIMSLAIAGALAGLGAAFYFLSGMEQWNCSQTAVPQIGFDGIAAAFLGGLHPVAGLFSSFFIQHITTGGSYIDFRVFAPEISGLITAIIIYCCAFGMLIKHLLEKGRAKDLNIESEEDCPPAGHSSAVPASPKEEANEEEVNVL